MAVVAGVAQDESQATMQNAKCGLVTLSVSGPSLFSQTQRTGWPSVENPNTESLIEGLATQPLDSHLVASGPMLARCEGSGGQCRRHLAGDRERIGGWLRRIMSQCLA